MKVDKTEMAPSRPGYMPQTAKVNKQNKPERIDYVRTTYPDGKYLEKNTDGSYSYYNENGELLIKEYTNGTCAQYHNGELRALVSPKGMITLYKNGEITYQGSLYNPNRK